MASTANCFVSEPLINAVEVIDVAATGHGQNSGLRQPSFVTKSGLATYLDNPSNQDYKCRYMFVPPPSYSREIGAVVMIEFGILIDCIDQSASEIHGSLCKSQKKCWTLS